VAEWPAMSGGRRCSAQQREGEGKQGPFCNYSKT